MSVAATLEPGVTEREVARQMRAWLEARGVRDWFHRPFVWFGDRTAFTGFRVPLQFFPTGRRLQEGMPYILDVAPVVERDGFGYTSDIGYSGCFGENQVHDLVMDALGAHRELIVAGARERKPLREIYDDVDRLLAKQGFENRHRAYPSAVLAHRVDGVPIDGRAPNVAGFGLKNLRNLGRDGVIGRREGWSPLWSPYRTSDHPPVPGLWAVEPHLGFRGVGAKFEELLVVTDDDAFWLDDEPPRHLQARTSQARTGTAHDVKENGS